jgi:hypothetical protein
MPVGRLRWFDEKQGVGRVVASGREYPVAVEDMDIRARAVGARVHFDIARHDGLQRAVGVRAVPGTRSAPRQRRFQDLTGAGRPEQKGRTPLTRRHPERDVTSTRPKDVVLRWIRAANSRSAAAAKVLYAVDVVLHDGRVRHGRSAVPAWLGDHRLLTPGWRPDPVGEGSGDTFTVTRSSGAEPAVRTRIRVAHGQIAEQWVSEP